VIPEDWEVSTAEQVCELVVDCKNRTPPVVDGSDYAVVRTPNVRNGKFVREELRFTDEQSFREWTARAIPQIGDILITREAPLGEVCLVPSDVRVCLGQRMMLYRPNPEKTDSRFFLYALMSSAVRGSLLKKIGGSTVGHAKVDDIRNLQVQLPPTKAEQETIAEALSDADALIESLEQLLAKKRQLKQGAMQELLTGKKRLPGFEVEPGYKQTEVGVIPEDWKETTIGDFAIKVGSGVTPKGGSNNYREYGRPFVRSQNVGWGTLLLSDLAYIDDDTHYSFSATQLKQGDVLLNITGASIGRSAIADARLAGGNVNQHVCIIRTNSREVASRFINYFLLSDLGQQQIDSFQAGGNREGLNFGQIRSIKLPLPLTIAEQEAIAAILSDMDAEIAALEAKMAKARQLKQGMMQELLTGRIRLV
jgi:type I restriction enzyme S subunit